MNRRKTLVVIAVPVVAVLALIALVHACRPSEEWSESYPIGDIVSADRRASLDGTPCADLCPGPQTRREATIRYCGVARRSLDPYILCELGLREPDPNFYDTEPVRALRFPEGLDPDARGAIDRKWCPATECIEGYAYESGYMPDKFEVTGCRVAERDPGIDRDAEFLVCSYTIRFGWFEALDIIAR